jgi:hypothetical protein
MKLTAAEIAALEAETRRCIDRIHQLTGSNVVVMFDFNGEATGWQCRSHMRGNPYAAHRMCELFTEADTHEHMAREIAAALPQSPEEGEDWKES